jgi:adenylate kinase family enzyme
LKVVTDPDYESIHPKFEQLILDHEEIYENMDANIKFYNTVVEPQVRQWLTDHQSDKIIPMDGNAPAPIVFQMLQMKLHMISHNPDKSFEELFGSLAQSTQALECCHRCGCRFATPQPAPDIWAEEPPRIVIFGKPCTGKTTLARRLCAQWNCQLVNATDLIINHLKANTTLGQRIRATMNEGKDLTDQFVFCILREKLMSPGCTESGYILDGVPTHSEKSHTIANQIEFLESLEPPPNYVIHIRIPDDVLRSRWGSVRIDVNDGVLYRKCSHDCTKVHLVRHPDFPELDDDTRRRLITRHEEIAENLDKHFEFYHSHMSPAINDYLKRHDSSKVISLDGTQSSLAMLHSLLYELSVMQRHPGTATSTLFTDFTSTPPPPPVNCPCLKHELHHYEPLADPWVEKPPRILILGKPCTGKTTLAKRLCATWGCVLVNATEIISAELKRGCELGQIIKAKLVEGHDLEDELVLELFKRTLRQHVCSEHGYILEGIPNHSELSLTVPQQMEFLKSLPNGPDYVIHLRMTDKQLRERWEDMRIDIEDGTLYSKFNYVDKKTSLGRWTRHPDFPVVDDATKERLITRHEELQENLDKHFEFYHRVMEEQLSWYMSSLDPSTVLNVDADLSPSELLQDIMLRFSVMARHPGVPTATLFEIASDESGDTISSCQCTCGEKRAPKDDIHISPAFWGDRVPRILVIGNSCSGKTTLAKKMCRDWGCILINASELIQSNIAEQTPLGKQIEEVMKNGEDLKDVLVLDMLQKKLESPECAKHGFVIDDIPTSSEKGLPIGCQMQMLNSLDQKPDFVIDIQIPHKELLKRWEAMRIDLADGALYGGERALRLKPGAHPTFPAANAKMRQRLITRYEELVENVELQDQFYRDYVRPHIDKFVRQLNQDAVICLDGTLPPGELYKTAYNAMRETLGT